MSGAHPPDTYRERIGAALADGWRFGGLHAAANGALVRTLLVDPTGAARLETCQTDRGTAASIVDLAPAAGWDEREAHDLYGVAFTGHEPLRPLVDHAAALERWAVPLRGHDPYQIAVGPIHAGVIESGHFRFHVVGDRILHLDAKLFYKHRGLERAAEGAALDRGLTVLSRACAACAVSNGLAYARACEEALGLESPPELARARTILLELERVWNLLNDIAAVCAGVGLAAGNTLFAALTERTRRLNAALTRHRFLFGTVQVGGSRLMLDARAVRDTRMELDAIRTEGSRAWREILFNASFQDRLQDVGILTANDAKRFGALGPAARAAGVAEDVRTSDTGLAYEEFTPVIVRREAGDVRARLEQKSLELLQSFGVLERLLDAPIAPTAAERRGRERPIGVGRVESPRGGTSCVVERSQSRIERVRLRTGSYANWPAVAHTAADNLLPDFPLINKSFELCYACADR